MKQFVISLIRYLMPLGIMLAITVGLYLNRDPYMEFRKYDNYSWKYNFQALGDLSTKKLLTRSNDYNSFIFGSSRSTTVYGCYLQKKLPGSKFFHFANWVETIGGVARKLELLDSCGYNLQNVIILVDTDCTFAFSGKCNASDHYLLTKKTPVEHKIGHIRSYFSRFSSDRLKILLGMPVKGAVFPDWHSDLITNDPRHICSDAVIANYGHAKSDNNFSNTIDLLVQKGFFYKRPLQQQYEKKQISEDEIKEISTIRNILKKHNSNYYIVITPLYDQKKFHSIDQEILQQFFSGRVFDFSGKNNITDNIYNYQPDRKHFQDHVGKFILDSIIDGK